MDIQEAVRHAMHLACVGDVEREEDVLKTASLISNIADVSLNTHTRQIEENIYRDDSVTVERDLYLRSFLDNVPKNIPKPPPSFSRYILSPKV